MSSSGGMRMMASTNTSSDTAGMNTTRNTTDSMAAGSSRLVLEPLHTLTSSGSSMLLYFYSDINAEGPGFNISYW